MERTGRENWAEECSLSIFQRAAYSFSFEPPFVRANAPRTFFSRGSRGKHSAWETLNSKDIRLVADCRNRRRRWAFRCQRSHFLSTEASSTLKVNRARPRFVDGLCYSRVEDLCRETVSSDLTAVSRALKCTLYRISSARENSCAKGSKVRVWRMGVLQASGVP